MTAGVRTCQSQCVRPYVREAGVYERAVLLVIEFNTQLCTN